MALKFIQAQPFSLAGSGTSIGDTTIILQSMVGIDGSTIVTSDLGDICYATIEPGNGTNEECISFTGVTQNSNGTATLTGVKTVGFKYPYTTSSGVAKTHAGGSKFILSNDAGFYNNIKTYADGLAIAGASDASTTTKGIVQEATFAQINAGTALGSTGAILVVTPDQLALSNYVPVTTVVPVLASDYSDGNVTISADTNLSRDMYYNTLTINSGKTLSTKGYRIFARSIVNAGTIDNSGGNGGNGGNAVTTTGGAAGTAGTGTSVGTLPAGRAGQAGGKGGDAGVNNAGAGGNGTNSTFNIVSSAGSNGGAGGASQNDAGLAGTGGTNTSTINPPRDAVSAYYLFDFTGATTIQRYNINSGSGGGGGGGSRAANDSGGGGGGSGASGGIVWIAAETITNTGTIKANGGNGGNGGQPSGIAAVGGGGGGGNGGVVILYYYTLTNSGTIQASGGTKGTGANTGVDGSAGLVIQITK